MRARAEIQKWHKRLICKDKFEVTGSKAYHQENKEGWFAVPISCAEENSQAFAGLHNRESTSFYLFDESSLIPDKIWEVAEGGLTDGEPMTFAFGNPTRNTGQFYEICFGERPHRWDPRSIDSRMCKFPNHALQDEWIQDHGIDSDFCKVRIRGIAPAQSGGPADQQGPRSTGPGRRAANRWHGRARRKWCMVGDPLPAWPGCPARCRWCPLQSVCRGRK